MATQADETFTGLYSLHKIGVCGSLKPSWNKLGPEDMRGALWQTPAPFGKM